MTERPVQPPVRGMTIFVSHPSECPTDHLPHGDGLMAYEFIRRLAGRGHLVHVAAPRLELAGPQPENVVVHPYRVRVRFPSLAPLETMLRVRRIFRGIARARTPDVVHQFNPVEPGLSVLVSRAGAPLVLGPFVPEWPDPPPPRRVGVRAMLRAAAHGIVRWADRVQTDRAAALVLSTPAAAARLYGGARHAGRVRVLPYGVDTARFAPPERAPAGPPRILFLANLFERKGIRTLLDAFPIVLRAVPDAELWIGGDGPERDRVRAAAAAAGSRILMLGRIERPRVPAVMRDCTLYCLPSYDEPFGVSALEAMACGRPVVVTDGGGLGYLVDDDGGRRVPAGDPARLGEALIEILRSPALAAAMGRHNRARVVREYDWDVVISQLERVYEEAAGVRADRRQRLGLRTRESAVTEK